MNLKFSLFLIVSLFFSLNMFSQEICNNGIDDDSDGLVDGLDPDCSGQVAWLCPTDGIVMKESSVYTVNILTGAVTTLGAASLSSQAVGYNTSDNLVWGITSDDKLFSLGSDLSTVTYPLTGVVIDASVPYNAAEVVSDKFIFYSSGQTTIYSIDLDLGSPTYLEVSSNSSFTGRKFADMSLNPVDGNLYAVDGDNMNLYSIDPSTLTESLVGSTSLPSAPGGVSFGKSFSDANGNLFTYSTKSGYELEDKMVILKEIHDYDNRYEEIGTLSSTIGGDGANCYTNALFTNEICDNGIDDDGDGDVDCDDVDCDYFEDCVLIDGIIASTETSCRDGFVTFQMFFTNNSNVTAEFDILASLATDFVYVHDSIDFTDTVSAYSNTANPIDGATGSLTWSSVSLEPDETAKLSFDAIIGSNVSYGDYASSITISGANLIQSTLTATITVEDCSVLDTYECDPAFYQVYKKKGKGQPNVYGVLEPITGDYTQIALASQKANGLGFDTNTGLVYGASGKKFIQLEEDGTVVYMGLDLPANCYRGDMDDNGMWWGAVGSDMIKVDPSVPEIVTTYSGQAMAGWDMAFNEDGHFYALHGVKLYKFDTTTFLKSYLGVVTGDGVPTTGYGGQWTGSDGRLYASNNKYGSIVRVDVTTLEARIVSSSIDNLSQNDGFSCPLSIPAVYEFDYGDNAKFPVSRVLNYYQDLDNNDIPDFTSVWIGRTTTYDSVDPKNSTATGDFDDGFDISTEIIDREVTASIELNSKFEMTAYYGMGVDWDDDGLFDYETFGSQLITGSTDLSIDLAIPEGQLFGNVNARLLVSEIEINSGNMSGDILEMGEVEDIRVFIYTEEDCTNGIDDDGDGLADCNDPDCINAEITSIYINQNSNIALTDGADVCLTEIDSSPVLMNSGVSGTAQSVVFTLSGAINEVIIDNDSPYAINLYPTVGAVTINVAAYVEDDGGGKGFCTAEEINVTFSECVEICGNGLDDDNDGLTDCDDPDCQFSVSAGNDKDIDKGTSGTLYGSATNGSEPYTYSWSPATDIDDGSSATPVVDPASDTVYTLTVTDSNGCSYTDDVTVYVDGPSEDPILYTCGWDAEGVPTCLENDPLECDVDFLTDVNFTYKEGRNMNTELPNAVQYDGEGDIRIAADDTEVFITYIHEGTPYENSLTYYTYNTNSPLRDIDEILDLTAVFPNLSVNAGASGDLSYGDKVSIGSFDSGTNIGFALVTRGWQENSQTVSDNYVTFYSNHNFNPESTSANKVHSQAFYDTQNDAVIMGFEEINRDYVSCDDDFNDVLFLVSSSDSATDFDTSDLFNLTVTNSVNPCVPCGMGTTDIGLYKGTASWNALAGAAEYQVRYRRWGASEQWNYRTTASNSINIGAIDGLDPGTHYEWQVSADFNGERGCNSLTNVFTTYPECQMPVGNAATDISSTSATISWGGVLSAKRYTIRFKPFGADDSEYQWRNAGSGTSLTLTGLAPSTTYDWNVSANCGDNYSCYGPYASAYNFTTEDENRALQMSENALCALASTDIVYADAQGYETDFNTGRKLLHKDVDGDGLEDVVMYSSDDVNKITVYLNSQNPSQRFAIPYNVALPAVPSFLTFEDVDFDDKLDILMSNDESEKVYVMKNVGGQGFVSYEFLDKLGADLNPIGLGAVDLSGGDFKNIISVNSGNDQLYVYDDSFDQGINQSVVESRGVFGRSNNLTTGKSPSKMITKDLNNDGLTDFLLINKVENTLTVFYHGYYQDSLASASGASGESYFSMHFPTGLNPTNLSVGDVNQDGMPEILVVNKGDKSISIYENLSSSDGDFMFILKNTLLLDEIPSQVFCEELNGNGRGELVVSFENSNQLKVFEISELNSWSYTENESYELESEIESIAVTQFSADQIADIAYIVKGADQWKFLENVSPEVNPWIDVVHEISSASKGAVQFKATSNLVGEYEWEIKERGSYVSLENNQEITGANTNTLSIQNASKYEGQELRVKLKDDQCVSSLLKRNVLVEMNSLTNRVMQVSPNPTKGEFKVLIDDLVPSSKLIILNPQGKIIHEKDLSGLEDKVELSFDLSNESRGTYIIKLNERGEITARKVVLR